MSRERLDGLLEEALRHRLTIVGAPAGSGKTTLLAGWAAAARSAGATVAWYRAESTDGTASAILGYLRLALDEALGIEAPAGKPSRGPAAAWRTVEEAAAWLERRPAGRIMLVVDDLHTLAGSEAESTLERFVELAAPGVSTVVGTRAIASFNIPRWRLSGDLLEVTGDDLRFRSWEVERLFRDYYGEVIRGDELGRLARRTEGWAAGLQLFHLATHGKSAAERAQLLGALGGSTRLIREYLARNVLDELPDELREFLLETCLLRRLSGPLCDRYLDRSGSARLLEELERRQVFTVSLDDGTYRYHEVLQAHLEQVLTEERGQAATRASAARAARLLEEHGAIAEALVAYCRAEQWEEAARVLGSGGQRLGSDGSADWLTEVVPALVRNDPWLRLASARRLRSEGRWKRSVDAFGQAEAAFGTAETAAACRTERLTLAAFLDPAARPPAHWSGALRAALRRDPHGRQGSGRPAGGMPAAVALPGDDAGERLAGGLASLAAGLVRDAQLAFRELAFDPSVEPSIAAAATIGAGTAGILMGETGAGDDVERGAAMAERAGQGWLARLGRCALLLDRLPATPERLAEVRTFREAAARDGDGWGEALAALAEGWALLAGPDAPRRALDLAASGARRLGAGTLEAWARGLAALSSSVLGLPDAQEAALGAESFARSAGVPGVRLLAYLALSHCDPGRAEEHCALAAAVSRETGLSADWIERTVGQAASAGPATGVPVPMEPRGAVAEGARPLDVCLLGGFSMQVTGRAVNLTAIKPRPRAVLRLLALNAGRPVHREVLAATFWPDVDAATAARNVHVALSGLRKELANGNGAHGELLVREGDAYRLVVPPGGRVDLLAAEDALAAARAAHARRDRPAEAEAYRLAIAFGAGELLPEDGPADWVVYRREEVRVELAGAARSLAELLVDEDPNGAAEACAAGLRLDPHHDGLWRLLIAARERAGDQAAAATARQGYARMLDGLGLESDRAGGRA